MSKTYVPVDLRRKVRQRANLICEYCLQPEGDGLFSHEVEHIVAEKHRGKTISENLALACNTGQQQGRPSGATEHGSSQVETESLPTQSMRRA